MSPQKPFSATLRWLREEVLGVATQVEMASKLGVSVYVYNNWERGRSEPKIEEFIRILSICPDRSSMQAFGIAIPAPGLIAPTKQKATRSRA